MDRQAIESTDLPDDIRSAIEPVGPSNSEEAGWTDFFESGPLATDDFERPEQGQQATREGFDDNPFSQSEEDRAWLNDKPVGREEI
ncbi:hypothetical protein [Zhongshania borealis]